MKNRVKAISLIMFDEHSNTIMLKALVSVIYTIQYKFIYIDYLYLHKEKLSNHEKNLAKKNLMF